VCIWTPPQLLFALPVLLCQPCGNTQPAVLLGARIHKIELNPAKKQLTQPASLLMQCCHAVIVPIAIAES
jgi:hypothetical protein